MNNRCPLNGDRICPVCSFGDYDPVTGQYDGIQRIYCGYLTGADTTINGFDKCVLKIPNHGRRAVQKRKDKIVEAKRLMLKM